MANEPRTLKDAIVYFSNPDNCLNYLVARAGLEASLAYLRLG